MYCNKGQYKGGDKGYYKGIKGAKECTTKGCHKGIMKVLYECNTGSEAGCDKGYCKDAIMAL